MEHFSEVDLDDYYWPDRDNTFDAFIYSQGEVISPAPIADQFKAIRTLEFTGLDKHPLKDPAATD